MAVEVDQLHTARAVGELPHLVRVLETLSCKLCHGPLPASKTMRATITPLGAADKGRRHAG
jgi:hypothetical protein